MSDFRNKKILITGAGKGIGRACAIRFAEDGATVIINYLSALDSAEETLIRVEEAGGKGILVQGDVGDPKHVRRIFEASCADGKIPDVLVLNAAFQKKATFSETDTELLQQTFDVNILGNFSLSRLFIDHWKEMSMPGNIVIHSSNQGEFVNPTGFAYALTKAALNHMVRHIARAVAGDHIRVNGIILGWFNTEGEQKFYSAAQIEEQAKGTIPLGRAGKPEEAAGLTYFLASDASSYMTGSLVRYDGGFALDPDLST